MTLFHMPDLQIDDLKFHVPDWALSENYVPEISGPYNTNYLWPETCANIKPKSRLRKFK